MNKDNLMELCKGVSETYKWTSLKLSIDQKIEMPKKYYHNIDKIDVARLYDYSRIDLSLTVFSKVIEYDITYNSEDSLLLLSVTYIDDEKYEESKNLLTLFEMIKRIHPGQYYDYLLDLSNYNKSVKDYTGSFYGIIDEYQCDDKNNVIDFYLDVESIQGQLNEKLYLKD